MAEEVRMVAICATCGSTNVKRDENVNHPGIGDCAHCGRCYIEDRPASAVELQQRMEQRRDEKLKRDSKLREEWLGREFIALVHVELFGVERLRFRLDAYDPKLGIVKVRPMWGLYSLVPWTTDDFWSMLESGKIQEG